MGEIEVEGKVLVVKKIEQTFYLTADERDRAKVKPVLGIYADSCPVARSVKGSIEISSALEFSAA